MTISNEAVEAAANAMVPVVKKLEALILARAALEAAAPFIRADAGAKALEDAAEELDAVASLTSYNSRDEVTATWLNAAASLRARAAAVRGEG